MNKKLYLENIGIIKEANINLEGLSVIAGENDTGKSTVGKILMALIKTHNMSEWKTKNLIKFG
ncbi:AAA family ATPase [Campylobacter coli]